MNGDEWHTSAMVDAVREMAQKLDIYQQHADEERTKLRADVYAIVEAMRKDVFKTIAAVQLDTRQHRDEHAADRKERAADAIDRLNRQLVLNIWLGALTALVVINLLLIGFVVIRTAQMWFT